jgi:hypothetical protein
MVFCEMPLPAASVLKSRSQAGKSLPLTHGSSRDGGRVATTRRSAVSAERMSMGRKV